MSKVEALNVIKIDNGICFMCGRTFIQTGNKRKTEHHCIPQCLEPMFNIIVPLHYKCHEELNSLYAISQPKAKVIGITILKRALNDVQGLKGSNLAQGVKIEKVEAKLQKAVNEREVKK